MRTARTTTAAPAPMRSIARDRWIDLAAPPIDAAQKAPHAKSARPQPLRSDSATRAMVAKHDQIRCGVQGSDFLLELAHGQQPRLRNARNFPFPPLSNVHELYRIRLAPIRRELAWLDIGR